MQGEGAENAAPACLILDGDWDYKGRSWRNMPDAGPDYKRVTGKVRRVAPYL
jgi:hypothetical protein